MVTILVHGSDPASVLPERRKSRGTSTWMTEIGSPRAMLSTLHFLHAGHQGYAAVAATTATLPQIAHTLWLEHGDCASVQGVPDVLNLPMYDLFLL